MKKLLGWVALVAYVAWSEGFVISKLWAWHAVPHGAPVLGWPTFSAALLALMVSRNTIRVPREDWREKSIQRLHTVLFLVFPWVALFLGWWWR